MKYLLKVALNSRKHLVLLLLTVVSILGATVASQTEIMTIGVIASKVDFKNEVSSDSSAKSKIVKMASKQFELKQKNSSLINRYKSFFEKYMKISENMYFLGLFLFMVAIFKGVAIFCNRFFNKLISIKISSDLRLKYFDYIQTLDMSFYNKYDVGSLSARINTDANIIAEAINSMLSNYIQMPICVISTLIMCLLLSWKLTLVIVIGFPLTVLPVILLAKIIRRTATKINSRQETGASLLLDFLSGILTVKAFSMEKFSFRKYKDQNDHMINLEKKSSFYEILARPILHVVASLFFSLIIIFGFYFFAIPISEIFVFCGLVYIFYEPIKRFAEENNKVLKGCAAAERMFEVFKIESEIKENKDSLELQFVNKIEFQNVCFSYGNAPVLKGVDFSICSGETVAIVGPTGGGKSSLAQLLIRLYDFTSGKILINGIEIQKYKINSLRDKIAFVTQKPFLFFDTVRENIKCGRDYSDEDMFIAAKQADIDVFIDSLDEKYDFVLKGFGGNFSGGQQQRIAIARALIKKANVLILDEATSALDALSEYNIKNSIKKMPFEIKIVIAHKASAIEGADKIVYLNSGRVEAVGSKEELLETSEGFKRVWNLMKCKDN